MKKRNEHEKQSRKVILSLTPAERERLDRARGLVPAATWIRDALNRAMNRDDCKAA